MKKKLKVLKLMLFFSLIFVIPTVARAEGAVGLGNAVAVGVEDDSLQARNLKVYLDRKEAEEEPDIPTEIQKEVAERAEKNRGTVSADHGRCAAWVSGVYQASGLGYPGGNAIDYWHRWKAAGCPDYSDIPLGAVVVGSGSKSESGKTYGHVGIYIGDGKIAHNAGGGKATISSIEEFENYYCAGNLSLCEYPEYRGRKGILGWVWPFGLDLSVE